MCPVCSALLSGMLKPCAQHYSFDQAPGWIDQAHPGCHQRVSYPSLSCHHSYLLNERIPLLLSVNLPYPDLLYSPLHRQCALPVCWALRLATRCSQPGCVSTVRALLDPCQQEETVLP